jgi:hypothetical protein
MGESKGHLDPKDLRETKEILGLQDRRDPKGSREFKDHRVRMEHRDLKAIKEIQALPEKDLRIVK